MPLRAHRSLLTPGPAPVGARRTLGALFAAARIARVAPPISWPDGLRQPLFGLDQFGHLHGQGHPGSRRAGDLAQHFRIRFRVRLMW